MDSIEIVGQMNLDMNFLSGLSPLIMELCLLRSSNGVSVGLGMKFAVKLLLKCLLKTEKRGNTYRWNDRTEAYGALCG